MDDDRQRIPSPEEWEQHRQKEQRPSKLRSWLSGRGVRVSQEVGERKEIASPPSAGIGHKSEEAKRMPRSDSPPPPPPAAPEHSPRVGAERPRIISIDSTVIQRRGQEAGEDEAKPSQPAPPASFAQASAAGERPLSFQVQGRWKRGVEIVKWDRNEIYGASGDLKSVLRSREIEDGFSLLVALEGILSTIEAVELIEGDFQEVNVSGTPMVDAALPFLTRWDAAKLCGVPYSMLLRLEGAGMLSPVKRPHGGRQEVFYASSEVERLRQVIVEIPETRQTSGMEPPAVPPHVSSSSEESNRRMLRDLLNRVEALMSQLNDLRSEISSVIDSKED